jgi:peptidoglycan/xylan/chitin deacetylase (PgdA/CDA1 family)
MSLIRTAGKEVFAVADRFLPNPTGPRILIYHQVEAGLGRQMEVTLADFKRQMDWLAVNRRVVDLDTALDEWTRPQSEQLVVLTFDDGYRDTYSRAYPILTEHGFPFVLYLATESIETGVPLGPSGRADPLTWDQVGEMLNSGLATVGSHTHRHIDLRTVDHHEIEDELTSSDDLIERRLGRRSEHFAYPWGYWSAEAALLVDQRYRSAALTATVKRSHSFNPHRLHRVPIQLSDGFRFFQARLGGGLRLEEWLRRRVRDYRGP